MAVSKTNLRFIRNFMRGLVITGCGLTLAYDDIGLITAVGYPQLEGKE